MSKRANITTLSLSKLKPAAKGARYDVSDVTRGLGVRVNDRGVATFVYVGRFPGKANPERRTIGTFQDGADKIELGLLAAGKDLPRPPAVMSLARARDIAMEWSSLLAMGIDPKQREQEIAEERARRRVNTFAAVVEDYLKDIPNRKRNRHADQDKREIERELLKRKDKDGKEWKNSWAQKPIADVTDADIASLIGEIRDRPAPGMAYNVLGHIKAIFGWAMWPERRHGYGLTVNPIGHLQPRHFRLSKTVTTRVLSDIEIVAYWKAAAAAPYPLGPFYRMLILTGQRKSEVSDAMWSEFDTKNKVWTVPPERFKSGQSHIVPLSEQVISLIGDFPRFEGEKSGDCVFSTTEGRKPINGFSKAKADLDAAMLAILRADDERATLPDWTFHDIRRTVRTRLSGLRISGDIAEAVIGHSKLGLRRVYDQYEFLPEMRDALEKWAAALMRIVEPPSPDNVVSIDRKTA